jgi:hypothetical protein
MPMRSDGIFTHEEWDKLHNYSKFLGPTVFVMRLREKDPAFNRSCHRVERCAWWNRDEGMVVEVEGLNPMERLR